MPERKWYKDRPIRRTRRVKNNLVKIIFDDGPKGQPGDVTYVPEVEYAKKDANGIEVNVRREFVGKDASDTPQSDVKPETAQVA